MGFNGLPIDRQLAVAVKATWHPLFWFPSCSIRLCPVSSVPLQPVGEICKKKMNQHFGGRGLPVTELS